MKLTLTLLAVVTACCTYAQPDTKYTPKPLSVADSIRVADYWRKANQVRLFSQQRQQYLDSALTIAPWRAYYWQQKAMPLSKQMKHELANRYLDSAVKYDPQQYLPYRAYLKCIFSREYMAAMQDFYAARVINGNSGVMDHPYDFYIGLCHLQMDNFDSARYLIQKCIDYKTRTSGADWAHYLHWWYVGVTHYEQQDYTRAMACFDSSLRLNPTLPEALYYKGMTYEAQGNKAAALRYVQQTDSLMNKGYTINEDNARYETYPYQVRKYYLQLALARLQDAVEK